MSNFEDSELEILENCPNCNSGEISVIYNNSKDFVCRDFERAWGHYRCDVCTCIFLNPRPKIDFIQKAYTKYHTHDVNPATLPQNIVKNQCHRFKIQLQNGYRNYKWGNYFYPFNRLGILYGLFPFRRRSVLGPLGDVPKHSNFKRILDVGSGNGKNLKMATALGMEAYGVDFDNVVVEDSRKKNLNVSLGGIETWRGYNNFFDIIILSHVFEHLYEHDEFLGITYDILKPGGWIWLETPNKDSYGSGKFGKYWRGLEPPRHLMLFGWDMVEAKLKAAGFTSIQRIRKPFTYYPIGIASALYRSCESESALCRLGLVVREKLRAFGAEIQSVIHVEKSEYVTLLARKG